MAKRYLTSTQAAEFLGVHPATVRRWQTNKTLIPDFTTPERGDRRYRVSSLLKFKREVLHDRLQASR